MADPDDDAWRSIVENYGERPQLEEDQPAPTQERLAAYFRPPEIELPAELSEPTVDDSDRFVPPTPAPIDLRPDRTLAWAGVLGAPVAAILLVALSQLTSLSIPGWAGLLLAAAFLGGFGYLVATMRKAPEDPWDDGAVL